MFNAVIVIFNKIVMMKLPTDYGLDKFRQNDPDPEEEKETIKANRQSRVYLAPELTGGFSQPTSAADIYAFAIILVEIATRNDPHGVKFTTIT